MATARKKKRPALTKREVEKRQMALSINPVGQIYDKLPETLLDRLTARDSKIILDLLTEAYNAGFKNALRSE